MAKYKVLIFDIGYKQKDLTFMADSVKFEHGEVVPLKLNFDKVVGEASLERNEKQIFADIKFHEPTGIPTGTKLYPSVQIQWDDNGVIGGLVYDCKIISVGLCLEPNVDPEIKPIILE